MEPLALDPAWAAPVTVRGTVTFARPGAPTQDGTEPQEKTEILRDREVCGAEAPSPLSSVDITRSGGVDGVLVAVRGPVATKGPRASATNLTVVQKNCMFSPRFAVLGVGSRVVFENHDPLLHNVYVTGAAGDRIANYTLVTRGQKTPPIRFGRRGLYRVRCLAGHPFSRAELMIVSDRRYALTDGGGAFEIRGVNPGRIDVVAYHPDLGEIVRQVVVDGRAMEVVLDFQFTGSSSDEPPKKRKKLKKS